MKQKAILASSNRHKLEEIQIMLGDFDFEILTMGEAGLGNMAIIEDGLTFEENSFIKAKAVQDKVGGIVIADDSGLCVDALEGAPGVYSARYAGEPCDYAKNNEKLLNALLDVPDAKRTARFVTVITMVFEDGTKCVSRGEIIGKIGFKEKGDNGFGYDPLFVVPELGKTFAELSMEEKNKRSHRAKALDNLRKELEGMNQ